MKTKLFTLALSFAGLSLTAQSFSVTNQELGGISTGQTLSYWVDQSTSLETHDFTVTNNGSSLTAKVRKTVIQQADPGSTFYFCTDQNCYAPNTTLSMNVAMSSGDAFALITDFTPNNAIGTSIVRYSVFDVNNPSDSTYFFIQYNVAPTSVNNLSMVKASLGNPTPNPSSSVFNMNYVLGSSFGSGAAKMVIYNSLGAVVRSTDIEEAEGTLRTDVSTLDAGIYFCSLESNGKQLATRRFVVTH